MRRQTLLTIMITAMSLICALMVILILFLMRPDKPEEQESQAPNVQVPPDLVDYYAGYVYSDYENRVIRTDEFGNPVTYAQEAIRIVQQTKVPDPEDVKALIEYKQKRARARQWSKRKDLKKKVKTGVLEKFKELREALAWDDALDGAPPNVGEASILELVNGGYLERELDMGFLVPRRDPNTGKIFWRANHLDLEPPNPNSNKADPYYEVFLEYFDEQVPFGPAWIVNVETGQVVPRNEYAKLFERSTKRPKQIQELNQQLTLVVKALTNTQFANGLQLGSFLLQRFVLDHKACLAAREEATDKSDFKCDDDRIIGWTVDHLLEGEYFAFFQWVENGIHKSARWDVTLEQSDAPKKEGEAESLPVISFIPRGLVAIELMQSAETFCSGQLVDGKKGDGTEIDLCRDVVELESCPAAFNQDSSCNAADDGHCCAPIDGKEGAFEILVDPAVPDALARFNAVHKAQLSGEDVGAFINKVTEASAQSDIKPLAELFGARKGPLWPQTFDTDSSYWDLAKIRWDALPSATKGLYDAFASVLNEGDFVMAVQQLLSSQDGFTIDRVECDAVEATLRARLSSAGRGSEDADGDTYPNKEDACVMVKDNQSRGFAARARGVELDEEMKKAVAGDACACRWAPKPLPFDKTEVDTSESLRVAYRVIYQYRDGEESKGVGFFVIAAPYLSAEEKEALEVMEIQRWALRRSTDEEPLKEEEVEFIKEVDRAVRGGLLEQRYIVPIGELSEWAFWSVNPRNLKGRQQRARELLPKDALEEEGGGDKKKTSPPPKDAPKEGEEKGEEPPEDDGDE